MEGIREAPDVARRCIEHEQASVRGAIALVASGRVRRVSLVGLRFGERLLGPARQLAAEQGVRVVPCWGLGDEGTSLSVEPICDH